MRDPYKNNSYLKNDAELVEEVLFFEQFGRKLHDTPQSEPAKKDAELEEKDEKGER